MPSSSRCFSKNEQLVAVVTPEWTQYLAQARDLFFEYREELEPLVTHRISIHDAEQAFTMYERHEQGLIKAVLDVSCWETNCE